MQLLRENRVYSCSNTDITQVGRPPPNTPKPPLPARNPEASSPQRQVLGVDLISPKSTHQHILLVPKTQQQDAMALGVLSLQRGQGG